MWLQNWRNQNRETQNLSQQENLGKNPEGIEEVISMVGTKEVAFKDDCPHNFQDVIDMYNHNGVWRCECDLNCG